MKPILTSVLLIALWLICITNVYTQEESPAAFNVKIKKADAPVGGHVFGAKQCGGPGEFVEFRIETCNPSKPCKIKATGDDLTAEMDFVPVIDMKQLRFLVNITLPGMAPLTAHDAIIPASSVAKGVKHTVHVTGKTVKGIETTQVRMKYALYNVDDNSLRVCMEADVEWGS